MTDPAAPRPWAFHHSGAVVDANGEPVVITTPALARFIVERVNAYATVQRPMAPVDDMTDRYTHLIVALENDIPSAEAEWLIRALRQFRGVLAVEPGTLDAATLRVAEARARSAIAARISAVILPEISE